MNEVALEKLRKYCAYQDRCHKEVRTKLLSLKVYGEELEEIISALIQDNFLNEERFARSYARGKFRIKKWGLNKIKQQLKLRQISEYCIKKAEEEIDRTEYRETLQVILEAQMEKNKNLSFLLSRDKAIKYALGRGYEAKLIYEIIKSLEENA